MAYTICLEMFGSGYGTPVAAIHDPVVDLLVTLALVRLRSLDLHGTGSTAAAACLPQHRPIRYAVVALLNTYLATLEIPIGFVRTLHTKAMT